MARYLSPEWVAAADEAVRADEGLQEAARGVDLVIDQTVTRGEREPVRYHVTLGEGEVRFRPGPAEAPDVGYCQPYDVAVAIAEGTESAQAAFMRGDLTVSGDARALLAHQAVLVRLADVLGPLRSTTTFEPGD